MSKRGRKQGHFIEIDGPDGAGKTTQAKLLVQRLQDQGMAAEYVRQPGGNPFSEKLRELLLSPVERNAEGELWTFAAQRGEMLEQVSEMVEKGQCVIFDRGRLSFVAYEGYGREGDLERVRAVMSLVDQSKPEPTIVLLKIDQVEAERRRLERGGNDYYESQGAEYHARVAQGYFDEAERLGIRAVDGRGSRNEVADRIWAKIEPLL